MWGGAGEGRAAAAAGRTLTGWTRLTFKRERKVGFVGMAEGTTTVINVRRSGGTYIHFRALATSHPQGQLWKSEQARAA
jgi:hypothetical protein